MDVELLEDLGTSFGIWTTPTIQFFMNGAKVEELIGANLKKLDEIVFKLKEKAKTIQSLNRISSSSSPVSKKPTID